jgi:hypothetical protein
MSDFLQRLAERGAGFVAYAEPRSSFWGEQRAAATHATPRPDGPMRASEGGTHPTRRDEDLEILNQAEVAVSPVSVFSDLHGRDAGRGTFPVMPRQARQPDSTPPKLPPKTETAESVEGARTDNRAQRRCGQYTDEQSEKTLGKASPVKQWLQSRTGYAHQGQGEDAVASHQAVSKERPSAFSFRKWAETVVSPLTAFPRKEFQSPGLTRPADLGKLAPPIPGHETQRGDASTVEPRKRLVKRREEPFADAGLNDPDNETLRSKGASVLSPRGRNLYPLAAGEAQRALPVEADVLSSAPGLPIRTVPPRMERPEPLASVTVEPRPNRKRPEPSANATASTPPVEVRIGSIELHAADQDGLSGMPRAETLGNSSRPAVQVAGFEGFESVRRYAFWRG